MSIDWGRAQADDLHDYFNRPIVIGQTVIKPTMSGRSAVPETRTVVEIRKNRVYLNTYEGGRITPVHYSGRLIIVAQPGETFP